MKICVSVESGVVYNSRYDHYALHSIISVFIILNHACGLHGIVYDVWFFVLRMAETYSESHCGC